MRSRSHSVLLIFFLVAVGSYPRAQVTSGNTPTVILPRDTDRTISLSAFAGKTYLQVMDSVGDGIFSKINVDDNSPVTIATADQIVQTINQFDSKVGQKLFGLFKNGENDFRSIVARIQGQSLNPQQIRSALSPYITNLTDPSHANIALDAISTLLYLPAARALSSSSIRTNTSITLDMRPRSSSQEEALVLLRADHCLIHPIESTSLRWMLALSKQTLKR